MTIVVGIPLFLRLNEHHKCKLIGQKSLNLARLKTLGYKVPNSLVISTKWFEEYLKYNSLWDQAISGGDRLLSERILNGVWPLTLTKPLQNIFTELGPKVAVRSSAVDEDGAQKSFAGQYESTLNVITLDGLKKAILNCWASYYSQRVLLYRGPQIAPAAGMAVLLQSQLNPTHAGVCFSVNPMTGAWDELIIEAYPGSGDHVVSGFVLPDSYVLSRPKTLFPIGLRIQLRHGPTLTDSSIPSEVPVSKIHLDQIWKTALGLERHFRKPQDLEWAIFKGQLFLLQSRAVTTQIRGGQSDTLWSQAFIGERWHEPARPLSWSLIANQLSHLIEYPKTAKVFYNGDRALRLYEHAPYLNLSPFRHLIFKWPGARPLGFMLELLPDDETAEIKKSYVRLPDFHFYLSILRETISEKRWRRFSWNPIINWLEWADFELEMHEAIHREHQKNSLYGLWSKHQAFSALSQRYIGIHICSLLFANLGYQLAFWWLKRELTSVECFEVLRSHRTSPTTLTNQSIWKLANGYIDLKSFIEEFGHRAPNSWELFCTRWCESPEQLEPLIDILRGQVEPLETEFLSQEKAHAIYNRLSTSKQILVRDVQRYLYLREAQRFSFDQLLLSWKRTLGQVGDLLELDVQWLMADELESIVKATMVGDNPGVKWSALIQQRQQEWNERQQEWSVGKRPPYILRSEDNPQGLSYSHFRGIGISSGCVRGQARVLRSISEARLLQPGEILVVRSTDPAWTPLFVPAAGVVMEMGGMLSHGAIVARECGTPAVSGIEGITSFIQTGDLVELDGRRGSVIICS
ncbi:MAG: PEP/pyruvate-binding domain-containing protein [Myxococcota bacterium]